jgi:putative Mn2+ efflux pump MntP
MDVLTWFLLALPLALDVFAAGLVFGLTGLE